MREPGNAKKRRDVGAKKRKAPEDFVSNKPKGATDGFSVQIISDTLDIMDRFPNTKGFQMVKDNAPIHSRDVVDPIILKIGHTSVNFLSYLPELNPIEMLWKVQRTKLEERNWKMQKHFLQE